MILAYSKLFTALAMAAATNFPQAFSAFVPADLNNDDIDWQWLKDELSAEATLLSVTNQDYFDQCGIEFSLPFWERTNFRLRNQTSGVCLPHFTCGIAKDCFPAGQDYNRWPELTSKNYEKLSQTMNQIEMWEFLDFKTAEEWVSPEFPAFDIPSSVLFPANAGDVKAAVYFAGENGLELSVKASGHNYAGASGKKDTLLVNTFRYKKYSPTGIVECTANDIFLPKVTQAPKGGLLEKNLYNQPCDLVLARGKNAFVRVGGGEAWVDVYRSVREFNESQGAFKYHVVGGTGVTVTPMGWSFQGGLSGNAGARLYGLGVDQVVQIDAVLPNGYHVRFGPTTWEDQEGFLYPRTISVSGLCNQNPDMPEEEWLWGPCPVEVGVNFDDLWFSFRGGGGGTWGVVTSMYLQLHEYRPLEFVGVSKCTTVFAPEIRLIFLGFMLDYMLDPTAIGVSEEESNSCGTPGGLPIYCYGEGTGQKFILEWKSYLEFRTPELLTTKNNSEDDIAAAADCFDVTGMKDWLDSNDTFDEGKDIPYPGYFSLHDDKPLISYNVLVSLSDFLADKQKFVDFLSFRNLTPYMSFGSNVVRADDQTTSLSKAYRNAAFMIFVEEDDLQTMLDLYGIASGDTDIPAFLGGNHVGPYHFGPLKSDPTKVCKWNSLNEAKEICYPTQVAVWGSKNLARLERIKEEIDPNYIFDCHKCVGNNRIKIQKSNQEPEAANFVADSNVTINPTADSVDNIKDGDPDSNEGATKNSSGSSTWLSSTTNLLIAAFAAAVAAFLL